MRTQIGGLVVAASIIQLANGFFGTFISLRVSIENFEAAGLVLSRVVAVSGWLILVSGVGSVLGPLVGTSLGRAARARPARLLGRKRA